MVFHMFISCTCDLHLKLGILTLVNYEYRRLITKWLKKGIVFPCSLLLQNLKTLKVSFDFLFYQVDLMFPHIMSSRVIYFFYKKRLKSIALFDAFLNWIFVKNCNMDKIF